MKGPLSARAWNALLDALSGTLRNRILSITALGGRKWLHPWHTTAQWNADKLQWEARIKPGFVFNGRTCKVTASIDGADVPLTDSPSIPLTSFRSLGTDAISIDGSGEGVPEFFKYRGVQDATQYSTNGGDELTQVISGLATDQGTGRLLRACEIMLYHDRPAASADWTLGTGDAGTVAKFAIDYALAAGARDHAYLRIASDQPLIIPDEDPAAAAFLGQGFADEGSDWRALATVYLLSPPDAGSGAEIDGTWEPYVAHHLFWNLQYKHTPIPKPANNTPLELNVAGLGGGAVNLQVTVNQMLAQNNDVSAALNELLRARVKGTFWTL